MAAHLWIFFLLMIYSCLGIDIGRIAMAANRADPRMGARELANRLPIPRAPTLGKRFLEEARDELLGVSRCVSVVVARSRIRTLRTRTRRAGGQDALAHDLDLLLSKKDAPCGPEYECVFCGDHAVRCLRHTPHLSVCEAHSVAGNRARDLRAIRRVLLNPPDEFFSALIAHWSAVLLDFDNYTPSRSTGSSTVKTMRRHWARFLAHHQMTHSAPTERVLSLWGFCCTAYPEMWEDPPPITSYLWSVVAAEATARDAEASARNGQQGGRPRDKKREREIARLAARGLTQKEIATKLGTAQCQVSRVLRRLRVP